MNYGLVTYTYGRKEGVTRATTAREVLPLIEKRSTSDGDARHLPARYPGYPLVASADAASVWFYGFLPPWRSPGWWSGQRPPLLPRAVGQAGEAQPDIPRGLTRFGPIVRRAAVAAGIGIVVIQLIPYGRNHGNLQVAPIPSGSAALAAGQLCPATFAPGTESTMTLGALEPRSGA